MYNTPPNIRRNKPEAGITAVNGLIIKIAIQPMPIYIAEESHDGQFIHANLKIIPHNATVHMAPSIIYFKGSF